MTIQDMLSFTESDREEMAVRDFPSNIYEMVHQHQVDSIQLVISARMALVLAQTVEKGIAAQELEDFVLGQEPEEQIFKDGPTIWDRIRFWG